MMRSLSVFLFLIGVETGIWSEIDFVFTPWRRYDLS